MPHNSKNGGGQRYFCLDLHDYAIFFSISKPADTSNQLKLRVISAYEVDNWGRHSLPKGKPFNVRYILQKRNEGKFVRLKAKSPNACALGLPVNLNIGVFFRLASIPLTGWGSFRPEINTPSEKVPVCADVVTISK